MPLLVRKISKAKWMQNDILKGEDVSADAITNCLKTRKNVLSTWTIAEEANLDEAVLAIVSAHEHLDSIDVVCLNCDYLEGQGIELQNTPGDTPVKDLVDKHTDICGLNYPSLGIVAGEIVKAFNNDKVLRYTVLTIKNLLEKAVKEDRLQKDDLQTSVQQKL